MAQIINLRQARKAKARKEKEAKASENRVVHGRTKGEKRAEELIGEQEKAKLDGHLTSGLKDSDIDKSS